MDGYLLHSRRKSLHSPTARDAARRHVPTNVHVLGCQVEMQLRDTRHVYPEDVEKRRSFRLGKVRK